MGNIFNLETLYDDLTGLPSMTLLINKLNHFIAIGSESKKFAIGFLNIDNFRYINQVLSQTDSNEFLKYIAYNLMEEESDTYITARIGGDKFAFIFTDIQPVSNLLDQLAKIKEKVCQTWTKYNLSFTVSFSMGISIYPEHGKEVTRLLDNAELAMSIAKKQGKDILFYNNEFKKEYALKLQICNELRKGLQDGEFELHYQPIVHLKSKRIIGVEALVRWNHHQKGMIFPSLFIPIAEESKQIYDIEKWIVKSALQQKKCWEEEGFYNIELSINLSSKTLENEVNFKEIEDTFLLYHVDYSKIVIEITETAYLFNKELAVKQVNRLKKLGMRIALDDFGTGFSSLTHLRELPIDIIKMDRTFVSTLPKYKKDISIIKNILSIAKDLNCTVIAEGIETNEQLDFLKQHACDLGQGYLFYKPLPAEKVIKLFT